MPSLPSTQRMRKVRIVCISDTHNQTPKLPKGDILIHAGDLTNQGSYSELKKTVEWLEKADFEAKIVIAGNHDITLDNKFYKEHGNSWKWPNPQDPAECRRLLMESKSITYLENESASIFLTSTEGLRACFKVFGSPYTPRMGNWAFQYEPDEAEKLWSTIPEDVGIVVTHTPPKAHCDGAGRRGDERSGCEELLKRLYEVRPMLSVFGHIHDGRGAERVRWNDHPIHTSIDDANGSLEEGVERWTDPGLGNKKISLVDLSIKGGRPIDSSGVTRQCVPEWMKRTMDEGGGQPDVPQPGVLDSTSRIRGAHNEAEANSRAKWKAKSGGAIEYRQGSCSTSDIGLGPEPDVESVERRTTGRRETAMINAALLGPRIQGKAGELNKAIVVDVDLPVWSFEKECGMM